ncbi:20168_t:CDS:1, partial [Racocetra persica]
DLYNDVLEQTAFANWEDSHEPIYKDINIKSQQQVVEKLEIGDLIDLNNSMIVKDSRSKDIESYNNNYIEG